VRQNCGSSSCRKVWSSAASSIGEAGSTGADPAMPGKEDPGECDAEDDNGTAHGGEDHVGKASKSMRRAVLKRRQNLWHPLSLLVRFTRRSGLLPIQSADCQPCAKAVLAIHLNVMRFVTSFPAPGLRACADPRQSAPSIGS